MICDRMIAARVALCGIGEGYVDDVTVREMDVSKERSP